MCFLKFLDAIKIILSTIGKFTKTNHTTVNFSFCHFLFLFSRATGAGGIRLDHCQVSGGEILYFSTQRRKQRDDCFRDGHFNLSHANGKRTQGFCKRSSKMNFHKLFGC